MNILDTFKNHNSVQWIKLANFQSKCKLNFSKVTEREVKKEILNLSFEEATRNFSNAHFFSWWVMELLVILGRNLKVYGKNTNSKK